MKSETKKQKSMDKMTAKEKAEYANGLLRNILEQIKNVFEVYCPPFQRKVIPHIINGSKPEEDVSVGMDYLLKELKKLFGNIDIGFRNKILSVYVEKVLPSIEIEYNKEMEEQTAMDELLALTEGKSAQEIKAMIKILKRNRILRAA
jgi:hypothetical protein